MRGSPGPIPAQRRIKTKPVLFLPLLDSCKLAYEAYGSSKDVMFRDAHLGLRSHLSAATSDFSGSCCFSSFRL